MRLSATVIERQHSSVRHLQALYTIVTGLALSDAIGTLVREDIGGAAWVPTIALLVALVVTLVPFFHGAMRHLDDTFIIGAGGRTKPQALAIDFVFLFTEGVILFLLAHWIVMPERFFWALLGLLGVDVIWALSAGMVSAAGVQKTWALINVIAVVVLLGWWWVHATLGLDPTALAIVLAVIVMARSAVDYWRSWSFYFPSGG